jgi:hypothetical protein
LGIGCHVLIEQGEAQNHPIMIGVDINEAGLPEAISRNQLPFGEVIYIVALHCKKRVKVFRNVAVSSSFHIENSQNKVTIDFTFDIYRTFIVLRQSINCPTYCGVNRESYRVKA